MAILIDKCRVCGDTLKEVWELGHFALCGYFPKPGESVPVEPMGLSWCERCDLTQMHYRYEYPMYTNAYGYRSGVNHTMVSHLQDIARYGQIASDLWLDDVALDIGGNDGTLLSTFGPETRKLLIDPTADKWPQTHSGIKALAEVFSVPAFFKLSPNRKAQLVFSIAMFYDLDDPVQFAKDVARCLASDGVWILEQSYLPSMVESNAFDTVCHEHLEYYTMTALGNILRRAGLAIHEASLNQCNGGSIRLLARARASKVETMDDGWHAPTQIAEMVKRLDGIKRELHDTLAWCGKVAGWGASTKGNTLLQHFGITKEQVSCIVDVNPEKWGKVTPGTQIPIVRGSTGKPDAYLVLPWHFREFVIERSRDFLRAGGKLIFPLPDVEVVTWDTLSGRGSSRQSQEAGLSS